MQGIKGVNPLNANAKHHRAILQDIAHQAMLDRGLLPDFSTAALAELEKLQAPAALNGEAIRDLRGLLWASIDNDDSRDLDQLTFAEAMPGNEVKILVAIADVDALVKNGSAIDEHARHNTTSVYTAAMIFPMLPERLSTNLTSLGFNEDRLSIVIEMVVGADGSVQKSDIYKARVRNHSKLAYNSVAAWLSNSLPDRNRSRIYSWQMCLRISSQTTVLPHLKLRVPASADHTSMPVAIVHCQTGFLSEPAFLLCLRFSLRGN